MINGSIGHRLTIARAQAGYRTVTAAAQGIGVSKQILCTWETNQKAPTLKTLIRLANGYGVSIDWLVGLEKPPAPAVSLEGMNR